MSEFAWARPKIDRKRTRAPEIEAHSVQRRAFTSVRSPERWVRYEVGDRWSAASEGVLAALRLSKSAQSADKVHFSDSSELPEGGSRRLWAVTVVSGHNRSLFFSSDQISAPSITTPRFAGPKMLFIGLKIVSREPTQLISLPASIPLPMIEVFARVVGNVPDQGRIAIPRLPR